LTVFKREVVSFCMQITVQTQAGLFIIPESKESDFVLWLQQNAIKAGQQAVYEQGQTINTDNNSSVRQLLNENLGGSF
jgi:uncharacterized protein YbdZ (MbtH family)